MIERELRSALTLIVVVAALALPAIVPPAHAEIRAHASRAGKVFSGDGPARLGTVRLRHRAALRWRAPHGLQIYDRHGFLILNSGAGHGHLTLRRGVYRGLRVATAGRWRIVIRR